MARTTGADLPDLHLLKFPGPFDEPNLVAFAGLVPVMRLAERCEFARLVTEKVKLSGPGNGVGAMA